MIRLCVQTGCCLCVALFLASPLRAQPLELRFRGADLGDARLLRLSGLTTAEITSDEELAAVVQNLERSGIFRRVAVERTDATVEIDLTPRCQITEVVVEGAREFNEEEIRRIGRVRLGEYFEAIDQEETIRRLQRRYEERGFRDIDISLSLEETASEFFCTLVFEIREGYQSRIAAVQIEGELPPDVRDLRERLRKDAVGSPASQENMESLRRNMLTALRREGYLQATVAMPTWRLEENGRDYRLNFEVQVGQPMSIVFKGHRAFSAEELLKPLRIESRTVPFTPGAVAALAREIKTLYQEHGFFDAETTWVELPERGPRKIFGIQIEEGPKYYASAVRLQGNETLSDEHLMQRIRTQVAAGVLARRWQRGIVLPSQLEVDREQIKDAYAEKGFFDTEVTTQVTRNPEAGTLDVLFEIREGPQRVVQDVELVWEGILDDPIADDLLAIDTEVQEGEPFSRPRLREEQRRLYTRLQQMGYPNVAVELMGNAQQGLVRYIVRPGAHVRVGEVQIAGLVFTRPGIVRRELELEPGDDWSVPAIESSRQNIAELGLFREVQIAPVDGALDEETEDLILLLKERPSGRFELGAEFTTEDGLHLFGELGQRNVAGRGHILRLGVDGFIKSGSSVLEAGGVRLGYSVPKVLGSENEFISEAFFQSNSQLIDEYSYDRLGAWIALHRELGERLRLIVSITGYRDSLFDVDPDVVITERDTTSTFYFWPSFTIDFDTRDNRLSPRRGYRSQLELRIADDSFLSEVSLLGLNWRQSFLLPLSERVIWANRLNLEALQPYGDTEVVPLSQRLFLGGQNSLRGFSKNSIAPREEMFGTVVGGDRALSASTELRYAFTETVTGLIFLDAGQAFLVNQGSFEGDTNSIGDLRFSPGFGAHYNTPIGPIRGELGFALDREFGERFGRVNVSIGTAF